MAEADTAWLPPAVHLVLLQCGRELTVYRTCALAAVAARRKWPQPSASLALLHARQDLFVLQAAPWLGATMEPSALDHLATAPQTQPPHTY